MKTYVIAVLTLIVSACGGGQTTSSPNTVAPVGAVPANSPAAQVAQVPASGAPVELLSCALTADKQNVAYKIKVNTDKAIDEVHLVLKTTAGGKPDETTLIWQNIVGSTRRPIETGKTYEDQSAIDAGVTKADCSLKEVIFKDGSSWAAK